MKNLIGVYIFNNKNIFIVRFLLNYYMLACSHSEYSSFESGSAFLRPIIGEIESAEEVEKEQKIKAYKNLETIILTHNLADGLESTLISKICEEIANSAFNIQYLTLDMKDNTIQSDFRDVLRYSTPATVLFPNNKLSYLNYWKNANIYKNENEYSNSDIDEYNANELHYHPNNIYEWLFPLPLLNYNFHKQEYNSKSSGYALRRVKLYKVIKDGKPLMGIRILLENYIIKEEDINHNEPYTIRVFNTKTSRIEEYEINGNSLLAILDRVLREAGFKPEYEYQSYINTENGREEQGFILKGVEGDLSELIKEFGSENLAKVGLLYFVNGKEPGKGSIPLDNYTPRKGEKISLAYVIQGMYKGDYGDGESYCIFLSKEEEETNYLEEVYREITGYQREYENKVYTLINSDEVSEYEEAPNSVELLDRNEFKEEDYVSIDKLTEELNYEVEAMIEETNLFDESTSQYDSDSNEITNPTEEG